MVLTSGVRSLDEEYLDNGLGKEVEDHTNVDCCLARAVGSKIETVLKQCGAEDEAEAQQVELEDQTADESDVDPGKVFAVIIRRSRSCRWTLVVMIRGCQRESTHHTKRRARTSKVEWLL